MLNSLKVEDSNKIDENFLRNISKFINKLNALRNTIQINLKFAEKPVAAASMAVVNSKKVSFDINYILAFVAKRKKDSGMIYPKLVGRELDHIKRINLLLTKKWVNNCSYQLRPFVQVEVFSQGHGKDWIGIPEGI